MKLKCQIVFVAFLLVSTALCAQADDVDSYVQAQMQKRHIPGLSLAVVRDGKVIKAQGYGLANVELNVPATVTSVYEIGSVTKQFTATAVMMLVEEGKLKLDDPLSKHLTGLPEAWREVTVRHLLTHTSGIKNYTGLPGFEVSKNLTGEQFIKAISDYPLDFAPSEKWSYSNTGYNLLGHIIERISGQSYWKFIEERFTKSLGMIATRDRNAKAIIPGRATGYEWRQNRLEHRDSDLTDIFSAGALVSNVLDLVKWNAALDAKTLLRPSSFDQLWTSTKLRDGKSHPYGFGWHLRTTVNGHRLISHNGQTAGFAANISRYVDDKLAVIVLTNLGDIGLAGNIAAGVASLYVPTLSAQ